MSENAGRDKRGAKVRRRRPALLTLAFCVLVSALFFTGCAVEDRRSGLPPGAQEALDRLTDDIAGGRFDKVYAEAAKEWRETVSAGENEKVLARVRDTLGRVQSRAPVRASEQGVSGSEGHTLSVSYNAKFERGDAIEFYTFVERDGRWQLARYTVNSDALKP